MAEDTNYISGRNEMGEDKSKDDSGKKPLAAKKRVVAVPHYLRASTGSCHDACKYGKPHVFKEKPWRAVRRTSAPPPMTEKILEIQIFVDNKSKKSVGVDKLDDSPSNEAPATVTNTTVKKSLLSSRKSAKSEKTAVSQISVDNKLKKSVGVDKLDDSPSSETPATDTTVKKSFLSSRKSLKSKKTVVSQISVDNKLKKSVGLDKLDDSPSSEAPATDTTVKKSFLSSGKSLKSEKTVVSQISVDNKLKKSVGLDKLDDSPSSEAPATDTTVKKSFLSSRKSLKSEKTVVSQMSVDNKLKKSVGQLDDSPSSEAPVTNTTVKKSFLSSRNSLKSEKTVMSQIFVDNKLKKPVGVDKLDDSPSSVAPATDTTVKKSFLSSRKPPLHESFKLVKQEAGPLIDSSSKAPKVMKKAVLFPGRSSLTASSNFSKREDLSNSIEDLVSISTPSSPKVRSVSAGTARPNRPAVRLSISSDAFKGLKRQPGTDIKFTDSPRKVLTPPATTLSVKRSPQATTSLHSSRFTSVKFNNVRKTVSIGPKDQIMMNKAEVKKPNNEMVKEKTLHMIETSEVPNHFIQSPSPLSPESLNSSSQGNSLSFTSNEVELDSGSTDSDGDDSISNYNRSVNSKAAVDQDSTALKLKFRRGKVIELESGTRGPRKLRFKQGTILGEDQVASSGSRRKSFKKRVVDSDKTEVGTDQEKIALKHQEMVTKKDEHGLYNNVIEEAASKLVEKRKSKVKALVGAFETVISLQERKPSTTNKYQ